MKVASGRVELTSCVSVDYDMKFLPHFIKHYSPLVDKFSLIFHSSKDFNLDPFFKLVSTLSYFKTFSTTKWVGRFNAIDKVDLLNELSVKSKHDYILTADVDEFQIWDKKAHFEKQSIVWGKLRDRESRETTLPEITSEDIFKQFPLITNRTQWGNQAHKPCLFPSGMMLSTPHNLVGMEINMNPCLTIEHFRWAKGRLAKSEERLVNYRRLNKEGKKWTHEQNIYNNLPTKDLLERITEIKGKDLI
tara:strand:+ start:5296 stop:6036 length:741 start_codon:yes stop_codon:yes gene_type:complete